MKRNNEEPSQTAICKFMSQLQDLGEARGKGAERQGDMPQLSTCAVVLTAWEDAVQSSAHLLSLAK